jgi:polyhydroxyalkanoate synthesis regulator phasin
MSERLISGDWVNGSVYQDPDTNKITNDKENKARFFEHEIIDTAKSNKLNKVYRKIVKCDIKTNKTRDLFSALVKENSSKHLELMSRFPNAWKSFIEKGGSFGGKKVEPKTEEAIPVSENKDISNKEEDIEFLKKEYEELEDKRSARGKEIRAELKKLEG